MQYVERTEGMYVLPDEARAEGDVLASYYISLPGSADISSIAERFAVGQSLGTWVKVPGITATMRRLYQAKVASIVPCPAVDLETQVEDRSGFLVRLSVPTANFGVDLAQLMTVILGNDASTSMQCKLVDVEMPAGFSQKFGGPRFGIEGVRRLTGVWDRPLVLNMIKPCTGISPSEGAEIFYRTALGGVDLIKDDELLGDTSFSPLVERVHAYVDAAARVEQETGHRTVYIPNVTAQGARLLDNAERAVDAGAKAVMVSYGSVGYGMLAELTGRCGVPVLAHYAGSAPYYEGSRSGMSAGLAAGFFPRVAGADLALVNTPYGGYPMRRSSYFDIVHRLSLPAPGIRRTFPVIGGGVHPGVVELYLDELGRDTVLAPGGGIQGHPGGATAGVRAVLQAIEAWRQGVATDEYAEDHTELAEALDMFGYRGAGGTGVRNDS